MNRFNQVLAIFWVAANLYLFACGHLVAASILFVMLVPILMIEALPQVRLRMSTERKRRRKSAGLCLCCGYSLHGNSSGKCPECGTAVT